MSLQTHFIPSLIVFLLSFPRYYSLPGISEASGYDTSAGRVYPWYPSTIQGRNFGSKIISSKMGRSLAAVKTFNVNDYGAKGDGSDATEVYIDIANQFLFPFDIY